MSWKTNKGTGKKFQSRGRGIDSKTFTGLSAQDRRRAEEAGPQPEDIVMSPSGQLGSKVSVGIVDGAFIGEFNSEDEAVVAIKQWMASNQSYPTVWWMSDHGNTFLSPEFYPYPEQKATKPRKPSKSDPIGMQAKYWWDSLSFESQGELERLTGGAVRQYKRFHEQYDDDARNRIVSLYKKAHRKR